ncbi:MAG TPA: FAD-dependent monooxygenase [Verrucomicrobiae bacterium]|jgi:flavin-dependent dehydrogenase
MTTLKPITIIGGGLAGLTLGIGLRQRGVSVMIWEAGQYPRHRVCGEFISGRGTQSLQSLGLLELVTRAAARPANTAAFFSSHQAFPVRALPQPALCLSRFVLDALLADRFQQLGGELREGARWPGKEFGEGMVRASGRRLQPVENGWRWFGLKAHVKQVELAADLEMHLSANGYVGLCRLNRGEVNVCGLFRRQAGDEKFRGSSSECQAGDGADWPERLRGGPGSWLHQRLASAEWEESSFCAVAGLALNPRCASKTDEWCVGDALSMIAPVTGNGMSIAFESAELALEPLAAYARGELDWSAAQRMMAQKCEAAFRWRLRWAARLQGAMFQASTRAVLLSLATRCEMIWKLLFRLTR